MHLLDPITRTEQDYKIASERHRIARDIDNAWRAQGRQHSRHALSQTNSRRVDHRQVGLMKSMRENRALPEPPRLLHIRQVLLRCSLYSDCIRGLIVGKIG